VLNCTFNLFLRSVEVAFFRFYKRRDSIGLRKGGEKIFGFIDFFHCCLEFPGAQVLKSRTQISGSYSLVSRVRLNVENVELVDDLLN
jgi:hypothetical protein